MSRIFPVGDPESDPPGVHELSQRKGWEMIRRHKDRVVAHTISPDIPLPWNSIAFHGEALKRLMGQKGFRILRIHKAINDAGQETLVLSAADKNGKDLIGGGIVMLDDGTPCPPFCGDDPPPPPPPTE